MALDDGAGDVEAADFGFLAGFGEEYPRDRRQIGIVGAVVRLFERGLARIGRRA